MKHFIKKTFTLQKIKRLIIGETIGKFFAFMIGLWSTKLFTYQVLEKKSINNLFGIFPRKHIVIHRTPQWIELLFAALIGFLVMEIFYYFLQLLTSKTVWRKMLRMYILLKWKLAK